MKYNLWTPVLAHSALCLTCVYRVPWWHSCCRQWWLHPVKPWGTHETSRRSDSPTTILYILYILYIFQSISIDFNWNVQLKLMLICIADFSWKPIVPFQLECSHSSPEEKRSIVQIWNLFRVGDLRRGHYWQADAGRPGEEEELRWHEDGEGHQQEPTKYWGTYNTNTTLLCIVQGIYSLVLSS